MKTIKQKFFTWLLIRQYGEEEANRMILGARLMGNHLDRFNHGGYIANTFDTEGNRRVFFK